MACFVWSEHDCFDSAAIKNIVIDKEEQTVPSVFPNPFKDGFYISATQSLNEADIFVCDPAGRQVNVEIEYYTDKLLYITFINPKGDMFIIKLVNNGKEFNYSVYRN